MARGKEFRVSYLDQRGRRVAEICPGKLKQAMSRAKHLAAGARVWAPDGHGDVLVEQRSVTYGRWYRATQPDPATSPQQRRDQ